MPKGRIQWRLATGILVVAGFASLAQAGLFNRFFEKSYPETAKAAGVVEMADQVKIPLKSLESRKALFLVNTAQGRQLYYFALKGSDGSYRSALDACDVCYRTNQGYRQEGDLMVCNKCGQAFPSVKIGDVKGGCNPHPLPGKVEGPYLVIKKSDLAAGKDYFPGKRS